MARARSLRQLTGAEWITTSITQKAEEELGPLFAQHGLPPPKLVMQSWWRFLAKKCTITSSEVEE